jgi:hypothetical protein
MFCEDTNHGKQRKKKAPAERNIPRNIIDIKFSFSGAAQMIKVCEDTNLGGKLNFSIENNA